MFQKSLKMLFFLSHKVCIFKLKIVNLKFFCFAISVLGNCMNGIQNLYSVPNPNHELNKMGFFVDTVIIKD